VHLPCVSVREPIELEVDYDETTQTAMKEQQVDSIPSVTDA
jgi:hypothetical protein